MLKTKAKYIVVLIAIFIAMNLLNVSTVQAVEMTETEIQEIIDSIIPDTMNLDIPEIEYKKAEELVPANIKKILEEKFIQYEEVEGTYPSKTIKATINDTKFMIGFCSISPFFYEDIEEFYTTKININISDGKNNYPTQTKKIKLIYNNHNKYNLEDETYVKNLNIDLPKYFELPIDYLNNGFGDHWEEALKNYLDNINKDTSIDFHIIVEGGGGGITMDGIPSIAIFKNGILYDKRCYQEESIIFIPVIEVPNTIEKDKVKEYIIDVIEKYSYLPVTSIERGCTKGWCFENYGEICSNIPDIYTIIESDGKETIEDIAIIRNGLNIQEILNAIPETMNLDIPEIEFEKTNEIILSRIKNILKELNIQYEDIVNGVKLKDLTLDGYNIEISTVASSIYLGIDNFYTAEISIYYTDENTIYSNYTIDKEIQLVYNNHDDYNLEDEKYVKNLKLESPKYYEVDLNFLMQENILEKQYDLIGKYYTNLIENNSIVVKAEAGSGSAEGELNLWTCESGTHIGIFKNGVLYETRIMGQECTVPVINIPKNIKEDEINNYVINLITKSYKEFGEKITKIENGTKELGVNITDGYTVYSDYGERNSYIIIRKEKEIITKDEKTNIKFETTTLVVPKDTKLVVDEIKEEKTIKEIKELLKEVSDKYVVFDISLIHNNKKIQPNGKVKISIPVPNGYDLSKLVVYRIEEDETKVEFEVKVAEVDKIKYVEFETDHFSTYVLAEKVDQNNNSGNNNIIDNNTGNNNIENTTDNKNTGNINSNNAETVNNPQTSDNILFYVGMLLVAVVGITVTTKCRKYCRTK